MSNKRGISIDKLESLKQKTIINCSEIINYDNSLDLYETMIRSVFNGDLDDVFVAGVKLENQEKALELARKYSSLCFYQGDIDYWVDSIEGISLADLDLVSSRLLDNYMFLVKLADNLGENSLKQLLEIQKLDEYEGNSIIEHLRNSFTSDDILESVIFEMNKENGMYSVFNNLQKAILLGNPEGLLYDDLKENMEIVDIQERIKKYFLNEDSEIFNSYNLGDILKKIDVDDFRIMVDSIQDEYWLDFVKK